ncbi:MAG TPA: hypothetical protein VFV99_15495 [Kofleriaceae bacterium]|nr:hypothetical protein [Kofleriaceae bacterium]
MRRAIVVVVLLLGCREKPAPQKREPPPATSRNTTGAFAKPTRRLPPTLATTFISSVAEASDSAAAWTAIADAYENELATCTKDCRAIAYEIVLARKNVVKAMKLEPPPGDGPVELPAEVKEVVDAIDAYVKMVDPTDDEVAPMQFLAANALWHWRQPEALTRLQQFLEEHRDDPTAEYAANQLLHSLMQQNRLEELRAWVGELSGDETFLANKPELRATIARIQEALASNP